MVGEVISAASLAIQLAEKRGVIANFLAGMNYRLQNGSLLLPIFGAGGVGKSTLGAMLSNPPNNDVSLDYRPSMTIETIKLSGSVPGRVYIGPGQIEGEFSRADVNWPKIIQEVQGKNCPVIINVVAYGNHSIPLDDFKRANTYNSEMSLEDFYKEHQRVSLDAEIDALKKLVTVLTGTMDDVAFVTFINKRDLWHDVEEEVVNYYKSGDYDEVVRAFGKTIGSARFNHEVVHSSLTINNLTDLSGAVVRKVVAGYDIRAHVDGLEEASRKMAELVGIS